MLVLELPNLKQEYVDDDFMDHYQECFGVDDCFSPDKFKPGTHGFFELLDRSMILYENFELYCLGHPTTALDKELYERAYKISSALLDFYQAVALKDFDAHKENKNGA